MRFLNPFDINKAFCVVIKVLARVRILGGSESPC